MLRAGVICKILKGNSNCRYMLKSKIKGEGLVGRLSVCDRSTIMIVRLIAPRLFSQDIYKDRIQAICRGRASTRLFLSCAYRRSKWASRTMQNLGRQEGS